MQRGATTAGYGAASPSQWPGRTAGPLGRATFRGALLSRPWPSGGSGEAHRVRTSGGRRRAPRCAPRCEKGASCSCSRTEPGWRGRRRPRRFGRRPPVPSRTHHAVTATPSAGSHSPDASGSPVYRTRRQNQASRPSLRPRLTCPRDCRPAHRVPSRKDDNRRSMTWPVGRADAMFGCPEPLWSV